MAAVLRHDVNVTQRQCSGKLNSRWTMQVPMTAAQFRAKYIEGKHALLPTLPRPLVSMVGDHGYASLRDCVADLLGHGPKELSAYWTIP